MDYIEYRVEWEDYIVGSGNYIVVYMGMSGLYTGSVGLYSLYTGEWGVWRNRSGNGYINGPIVSGDRYIYIRIYPRRLRFLS